MSAYSDAVVNDGATTYLRLGETSGTTADDAIGSDDHTYQGSPTLGATSLLTGDSANKAVTLNGSSQYVSNGSPGSALDVGDTFTVECWLKRGGTGTQQDIWGRNYGGGQIIRISSGNAIVLRKSGIANIVTSTTTITDTSTAHHIVVTKSGSTVKIYIDGADVTGSVSNQTFGSVSGASVIARDAASSSGYLNGTLDEFAVYKNVALTSTQVADHYDLGTRIRGAAALSGTGTLTATAATAGTQTGAAALSGTGDLTSAGTVTRLGGAALSGSGTLTADFPRGAALQGVGRLVHSDYDPAQAIGVCVHPGWTDKTYNDYTNCFADIDEIGTKLLRGGGSTDGNITQWLSRCASRGIQMIYGSPGAISGITDSWLDGIESQMSSYPGVICAIEGLNEPDLNSYGEQDVGESSVEYAARHQVALYEAVSARFPDLPVLAPSIAGNSGWTEPLANKVAGYCTAANCHYYTSGGTADVSLSAVNTAFTNARNYAGVDRLWVTETGIRSPVTGCTDAEGATRLVGILDAMRHDADAPANRICVYQLESPDNVWADENDWALYWYGFSPKAKATALADYIVDEAGVVGDAALSGAGTLASAGVRTTATDAALSGSGALAGAGTRTTFGGAGLSGSGDLATAGIRTRSSDAALSGTGTLVSTGYGTSTTDAALSGSGTLAAAGVRTTFATAALSGSGTLAATGVTPGGATLSGTGTLATAGVRTASGDAQLSGSGTLATAGTVTPGATYGAALTGTGLLATAGVRTRFGEVTLFGTGNLAATGFRSLDGSASLAGTGVLGADGYATVSTGAGLVGSGVLASAVAGKIARLAVSTSAIDVGLADESIDVGLGSSESARVTVGVS